MAGIKLVRRDLRVLEIFRISGSTWDSRRYELDMSDRGCGSVRSNLGVGEWETYLEPGTGPVVQRKALGGLIE